MHLRAADIAAPRAGAGAAARGAVRHLDPQHDRAVPAGRRSPTDRCRAGLTREPPTAAPRPSRHDTLASCLARRASPRASCSPPAAPAGTPTTPRPDARPRRAAGGRAGWSRSTPATTRSTACGRRPRRSSGRTGFGGGAHRRRRRRPDAGAGRAGRDGDARRTADRRPAPAGGRAGYSGTNTHEAGVDEPDLVKTDGRRIVTVIGRRRCGWSTPPRRTVTGSVDLADGRRHGAVRRRPTCCSPATTRWCCCNSRTWPPTASPRQAERDAGPAGRRCAARADAGRPDRHAAGAVAATGSTAAWSTPGRSARPPGSWSGRAPRLEFPVPQEQATDAERIAANQRDHRPGRPSTRGCPGSRSTTGGRPPRTEVGCGDVSRPAIYSGTTHAHRADLRPGRRRRSATATRSRVVADGDTVYSNGPACTWPATSAGGSTAGRRPADAGAGRGPHRDLQVRHVRRRAGRAFVAGGTVPGWLHQPVRDVRMGRSPAGRHHRPSGSATDQARRRVRRVRAGPARRRADRGRRGRPGSARASGSTPCASSGRVGYVVTFRQTDPLYTVDLRDPARPAVTGELKITGYSAYLHPAGDGPAHRHRPGRDRPGPGAGHAGLALRRGRPGRPGRLAQYHVAGATRRPSSTRTRSSTGRPTRLLVVPLQTSGRGVPSGSDVRLAAPTRPARWCCGSAGRHHRAGVPAAPESRYSGDMPAQIRRSLVIDGHCGRSPTPG